MVLHGDVPSKLFKSIHSLRQAAGEKKGTFPIVETEQDHRFGMWEQNGPCSLGGGISPSITLKLVNLSIRELMYANCVTPLFLALTSATFTQLTS